MKKLNNLKSFNLFLVEGRRPKDSTKEIITDSTKDEKNKKHAKAELAKYTDSELKKKFIDAIYNNNENFIIKVLENRLDVNFNKGEAFLTAVEFSDVNIVELLLKKGADIKEYGTDALSAVSKNLIPDVLKLLIEYGVDVKVNNNQAIINAVRYKCEDSNKKDTTKKISFINMLIDAGADINAREGSPLLISIKDDQYSVVRYLLDKGAKLTDVILKSADPYLNDKMQKLLDKYKRR